LSHSVPSEPFVRHHRSLFLSDTHLGAFGSRADLLLEFLLRNDAATYLLVGDILDLGNPVLSRWTANHQAVIDLLHARMAAGARMIYVRGNHDPDLEAAPAQRRLPVPPVADAVHVAADGRRYLVVHGDGQDTRVFRWHLLTRIGSQADQLLRAADALIGQYVYDGARDRRSLIEILRVMANRGLYPGRPHERRLVALARAGGFDGVICGHYHMAELRDLGGLRYANCGDWMDSFTALSEDHGGRMQLLGGREAFAAAPRLAFRQDEVPA
jgi:UDP-2,3-diacylglucosamine pyrophosphatase LpxH